MEASSRKKMLTGLLVAFFVVSFIALCAPMPRTAGDLNAGRQSAQESSEPAPTPQQAPESDLPTVKTLWAEFDVKVDSLDENGIDFTFTNKQSRYEILVTVNYVTAGGITYSINDEVIHIAVDGESNDMGLVTIPAGSSVRVRFSVDGVSDYRNMKIEFNENDYNDSGENYYYEGASITVGE